MKSLPEVIAAVQLLQKVETERKKITLELKQEISDLQMKVSELIQRDKFVTELTNDNHTQNNSKQYESHEISKQKYAAVKQAFRLKRSTKFQNSLISEDLCHDFKISRQGQLSKYKEMKQQCRSVCFRGTELIEKKTISD